MRWLLLCKTKLFREMSWQPKNPFSRFKCFSNLLRYWYHIVVKKLIFNFSLLHFKLPRTMLSTLCNKYYYISLSYFFVFPVFFGLKNSHKLIEIIYYHLFPEIVLLSHLSCSTLYSIEMSVVVLTLTFIELITCWLNKSFELAHSTQKAHQFKLYCLNRI